jgi:uncharacterized membrane protein
MIILLKNVSWMGWNVFLALIPPIFGWLVLIVRQKAFKVACALIWFLFLPNTLYLITDLIHLIRQWHHVHLPGQIALALQYLTLVLIGLVTFILALYPVEKTLLRSSWLKKKSLIPLLIIAMNFFIGIGIVLGRVMRINSWDVIVDISKVISSSVSIFNSLELMLLVVFIGVFANVYYFVWRKTFKVS